MKNTEEEGKKKKKKEKTERKNVDQNGIESRAKAQQLKMNKKKTDWLGTNSNGKSIFSSSIFEIILI